MVRNRFQNRLKNSFRIGPGADSLGVEQGLHQIEKRADKLSLTLPEETREQVQNRLENRLRDRHKNNS